MPEILRATAMLVGQASLKSNFQRFH